MSNLTKTFKSIIHTKATELYGDGLPHVVNDRIEEELEYAAACGADVLMLAVSDAFQKAGLDAGDVSIRGTLGSSYLAYLLGVSGGIDPLPPHYRCANCKHSEFDVSENTRVGMELPDKGCPVCGKPMIGEGFDIDPWFFYGPPPEHYAHFEYNIPSNKLADVMKTLQKAEGVVDVKGGVLRMRFSESAVLHLPTPQTTNQLSRLEGLTGIRPGQIPLGNSPDTIAVREALSRGGSFAGIRQLMGRYEEMILASFKLDGFYDVARFLALCHGTNVWMGNGERLLKDGTITQNELPVCREDIFDSLKKAGFDRKTAFTYAKRIRMGKGLLAEQEKKLRAYGIPSWFIGYCNKIRYLFPKSHCVSEAITAWRLLYYKLCVDRGKFYQSFFETVEDISEEVYQSIANGDDDVISALESRMWGFPSEGWKPEDEYTLWVAKEMMEEGFAIRKYFRDALKKT